MKKEKIKSTMNHGRVVSNIPHHLTGGSLEEPEEFVFWGIVPCFVVTFSLFVVFFVLLPVENSHVDEKVVIMSWADESFRGKEEKKR